MMKAAPILILAVFTVLLLSTPAHARDPFTISGNVTDADGTPLPHAYVLLNGPPIVYFQNETRQNYISGAITDVNGHFVCDVNETEESQFSVTIDFISPAKKRDHFLKTALYNVTGRDIIIPDSETRLTDYVLPKTGFVHGLIVRESDRMLMTGTAYLSNGNASVVTSPLEFYVLEAAPGNYTVYAVCYDENGGKLASDKVEVQVLPMEDIYDVLPLDLLVRPVDSANFGALALALGVGLVGILALYYALRRLS
jgi:uncharacterized protein (DUF2141 family)